MIHCVNVKGGNYLPKEHKVQTSGHNQLLQHCFEFITHSPFDADSSRYQPEVKFSTLPPRMHCIASFHMRNFLFYFDLT